MAVSLRFGLETGFRLIWNPSGGGVGLRYVDTILYMA